MYCFLFPKHIGQGSSLLAICNCHRKIYNSALYNFPETSYNIENPEGAWNCMASEYYKWLARDVKPDGPPRELTPAEKRRNWWDYHKWHVVIGIVCTVLVLDFVWTVLGGRSEADYTIAYVGTTELPKDTVSGLETAFATLGADLDGNGKVQVQIQQYILPDGEPDDPTLLEQAAEQEYATAMQINANLQTAESVIFLLENPEGFQADHDGVLESWHRWSDCRVLTELELGTFVLTGLMTPVEGSNQEAVQDLYIARRTFFNDETSPRIDGAGELYDLLTEGTR